MRAIDNLKYNPEAEKFCREYLEIEPGQRFILGRNEYAKAIAELIEIGGFIDDFTEDEKYLGKPIVKSEDVPSGALVLSTLLGRPFAGEKRLREIGVKHLDYFAFYHASGLPIPNLRFWGGFTDQYAKNEEKFNWIRSLLADDESISTFEKIISFRLTGNLSYMEGFSDREKFQYFEPFLGLRKDEEVFVDVGGFDGYTSLEFIKKCPGFKAIYFFEPDSNNMSVAQSSLGSYENVYMLQCGLSNQKDSVRFSSGGSISSITKNGDVEIEVDVLDDIVKDDVTFIKMDIEGAESLAIEGAKNTILKCQPRLAICVYHKKDDFWRIPEQILSIRSDYDIYLRHYTEGVAETVMFFIPKKEARS